MPLEGDEDNHYPGNAAENVPADQASGSAGGSPPTIVTTRPQLSSNRESGPAQSGNKWRENTKFGLEVFGVVLLFAYTWFSCLQWLQIRWTNQLTREALNGNNVSLNQTLSKMQAQADAMNRVADKVGIQADKMDGSIYQASRLATDTETANQTIADADRPWIGSRLKVISFTPGQDPSLEIDYVNSGRRPAIVDRMIQFLTVSENFPDPESKYVASKYPSKGLMLPGSELEVLLPGHPSDDLKLTPELMNSLNSKQRSFFVIGKVEYRDAKTNRKHWVHSCFRLNPEDNSPPSYGFRSCTEYNDTDSN